jgi:hypothetical protein
LEAAGSGKLGSFGKGQHKISLWHVDNYCHGLICGADDALYKGSPALLATYYLVHQYFWKILNRSIIAIGFLLQTWKASSICQSGWLLYGVGCVYL